MNNLKNKIEEPILLKAESDPLDFKELTFKDFIIIQNAAQKVANNIGYGVYLVGSAIHKHKPRDIDLSIIIPYDDYLKKYNFTEEMKSGNCLQIAFHLSFKDLEPLVSLYFEDYKIDLKICPDNWWPDKEKILLAEPQNK